MLPDKFLFRVLGRLGLRSLSEPHLSLLKEPIDTDARPVWVFGFARTGTTTAQSLTATVLGFNASFEPFGRTEATQLSIVDAHDHFNGNPQPERWDEYVSGAGVNLALATFGSSSEGRAKRAVFEAAIEKIYAHYGRNCVVKEIRLAANIDAVAQYHEARGIGWDPIGVIAHPFQPLYSYYRFGGLCRPPYGSTAPAMLHRYRVAAYERLGWHEELRALPTRTPAEKLVVACLLDQETINERIRAHGGFVGMLPELPEHLGELAAVRGRSGASTEEQPEIRRSVRYARDPLFRQMVLDRLQPEVQQAVEDRWGPTPDPSDRRPGARERMTGLRYRLYA